MNNSNYWIDWMRAAGIRALKTFAQTLAGFVVVGVGINEINWPMALSVSATAAIGSLLTSLAGIPEVKKTFSDPCELPTDEE